MECKLTIYILFITLSFSRITSSYTLSDTLPQNMPFSKTVIWGEGGLARKFNIGPKDRIGELKLRHKMLQAHQKLGLLTLGMMSYQYYVGNQMVNRGSYEDHNLHRKLGYSIFGVYMTAAGFSVLSPPALK